MSKSCYHFALRCGTRKTRTVEEKSSMIDKKSFSETFFVCEFMSENFSSPDCSTVHLRLFPSCDLFMNSQSFELLPSFQASTIFPLERDLVCDAIKTG